MKPPPFCGILPPGSLTARPSSKLLNFGRVYSQQCTFRWGGCLHTLDIILWWLGNKTMSRVTFRAEILRAPVEVGSWNPTIYSFFFTSQVVVWDFWTINSMLLKCSSQSSCKYQIKQSYRTYNSELWVYYHWTANESWKNIYGRFPKMVPNNYWFSH